MYDICNHMYMINMFRALRINKMICAALADILACFDAFNNTCDYCPNSASKIGKRCTYKQWWNVTKYCT